MGRGDRGWANSIARPSIPISSPLTHYGVSLTVFGQNADRRSFCPIVFVYGPSAGIVVVRNKLKQSYMSRTV